MLKTALLVSALTLAGSAAVAQNSPPVPRPPVWSAPVTGSPAPYIPPPVSSYIPAPVYSPPVTGTVNPYSLRH
jgi:hypothetical protein